MMRLRILPDWPASAMVGGLLAVLYLAHAYFGSPFTALFRGVLLLLILDLTHPLWTARSLWYYQDYSTTRPNRGDGINYRLHLSLQTFIWGCRTRLALSGLGDDSPGNGRDVELVEFYLSPDYAYIRDRYLICPRRGSYTIGLSRLELHDQLRLFKLELPISHQKIQVRPKRFELSRLIRLKAPAQEGVQAAEGGLIRDETGYGGIRPYRPGESIRHLDWKRFGGTGQACLREHEAGASPGILLYLDRRKFADSRNRLAEAQDRCVEALLAVAAFYIRRKVPIYLEVDRSLRRYDHPDAVEDLYSWGASIEFASSEGRGPRNPGTRSPAQSLRDDLHAAGGSFGLAVAFSTGFDGELADFLEASDAAGLRTRLVVIDLALSSSGEGMIRQYKSTSHNSDYLISISSPDQLEGDGPC